MILIILAPKAGNRARERQRFKRIQTAEALAPQGGKILTIMMLFIFSDLLGETNQNLISQILFFCITCFSHLALITCTTRLKEF